MRVMPEPMMVVLIMLVLIMLVLIMLVHCGSAAVLLLVRDG
jgi:hypothetical protein